MRTGRAALVLGAVGALVATTAGVATAQAGPDESPLIEQPGMIGLESTYSLTPVVSNGQKLVSVIVDLEVESVSAYAGGIPGLAPTNPRALGQQKLNPTSEASQRYRAFVASSNAAFARDLAAAVPGSRVTQSYELIIGGVAALVPPDDIERIRQLGGVEGVYVDKPEQLDTSVTPDFIGATELWAQLGGSTEAGAGVIVANIDSGIWPEHPSVADPDPSGTAYPAPPSYWKGSGTGAGCNFGDTAYNPADAPFACNNKLLGAYDFTNTYKQLVGLLPTEFDSARDSNGHGTHTLTTAAGNAGVPADIFGLSRGTVSGIAPRAHVVAYKGCGVGGCYSSDTSAAIQQAVADGVDIVNYSISGGSDPYNDPVSLAMLDAYDAGTLVVPSAGNSGPGPETVAHREPWALTVGASTSDRHYLSTVSLVADNGDTLELVGASVTEGISTPTPVVLANPIECLLPFAAGTFTGEIVVCERGTISRVAKGFNVAAGGAGGLLLYNPTRQGLSTDNHFIPGVHLENDDGATLVAFMQGHTGVTATFTQGTETTVQGDVMAPFSSRGGPRQTLGISKPDVTAPGVQILAGTTPMPENQDGGRPGQLFQAIQGTSMSAPHAAGAAALLVDARPDWTPGEIKSALMMSALTAGVTKEDGVTPATPFDHGSGRILPTDAAATLMTIAASGDDFATMADHLWDANYPSLYLPGLAGSITVQRTITNQSDADGVWRLTVDAPADLGVTVPYSVAAAANGDASFSIAVDGSQLANGDVRHATLTFEKTNQPGQGQLLHFPITVVKNDAAVTIDKSCSTAEIVKGATATCSVSIQNNTFAPQTVSVSDPIPQQLRLDRQSVVGGTSTGSTVTFDGTLAGATPPAPSVVVDPTASPAGYAPLASFGSSVNAGATDESIANFNVPAFEYAGEVYNRIGIVSNGYVVVGGGTGADVDYINSSLPDAAIPNNVLAPFWTDLNPAAGGRVLVNVLSNGVDNWVVVEWESVRNYSDGETNTFQIWLGTTGGNPAEDISFTYGPNVSDGDGGFLTVGAENSSGTAGGTVYFDGGGSAPAPSTSGYVVAVTSTPGAPGEVHTITYDVAGKTVGSWTNRAELRSSGIAGVAVATFSGTVVR